MPQLANTRHELYATHRAKGMSPSKAAQAAGYASGSSTAAELEKDPEVVARIEEVLQELQVKRESQRAAAMEAAKVVGEMTGYSKGWVIQKLAENAQLASGDGDYKAANEALKLIGDEFGMFKGGSSLDDQPGEGAKALDLGALTALMGHTPDAAMRDVTPVEPADLDAATLSLIEGQGRNRKANRRLSTGSETDVALTPEAEPEEDLPAHDLVARVLDPVEQLAEDEEVEGQEVFDALMARHDERHPPVSSDPIDDDDTPPRRSRNPR